MSMKLISREDALDCVRWGYNLSDCYEKISNVPTVKAIPIEVVEQIRAELECSLYDDVDDGTVDNRTRVNRSEFNKGLKLALRIVDKAISEASNEQSDI